MKLFFYLSADIIILTHTLVVAAVILNAQDINLLTQKIRPLLFAEGKKTFQDKQCSITSPLKLKVFINVWINYIL